MRIRAGSTPWMTRCATRWASVSVLPVPAPAMISTGPDLNPLLSGSGSPKVTAFRWGPFNFSRCDVVGMVRPEYTKRPAACHGVQSRLSKKLPEHDTVGIQYFHLTQAELAHGGLDRGHIPDDDPGKCIRVNELARRRLQVRGTQGVHLADELVQVAVRQSVRQDI